MNYVVATVRAKQKPNLVMKQRGRFLVFLPLLLQIYFHDSLHYFKVFYFFKDGLNAPFPPYDLSCMSLGHSTYHGHQSVQFSVTAVIIFSICLNTSPEQVPNGFSSFVLQQLERVPFLGGKAVPSMSRESPALCLQSTRDLWSLECF